MADGCNENRDGDDGGKECRRQAWATIVRFARNPNAPIRVVVLAFTLLSPILGYWLMKKNVLEIKDAVCWVAMLLVAVLGLMLLVVALSDIWENLCREDTKTNGKSPEATEGTRCRSESERYQASVQLLTAEGREIWARHGFMAALNTLVVTLIGVLFTRTEIASDLQTTLIFASVAFGLLLCILWVQMMVRRWGYYDYYEAVCKELEGGEKGPFSSIGNLRMRRRKASTYLKDTLNIAMPLPGRLWGQRWFSYWVIMLFGILYAFLLFLAIGT